MRRHFLEGEGNSGKSEKGNHLIELSTFLDYHLWLT